AGSSHGLEMSSNYPPLMPALGAYFYVQAGAAEDLYLKAISPLMALLSLLCIYELGLMLRGPRLGLLASFIALTTPLFILYGIYETNYMLLMFFSSAAFLAALQGLSGEGKVFWVLSGVFCGFALLTSYQGMFVAAVILIASLFKLREGGAWFLLPALAIPSIWLARNFILTGDPLYPLLSLMIKPSWLPCQMLKATLSYISRDSFKAFFGHVEPSPWDYLRALFLNLVHYPSYSAPLLLGLLIVLVRREFKWILVALWSLLPLLSALTGLTWVFPRYFLLTVPGFALIVALALDLAFNSIEHLRGNVNAYLKASLMLLLTISVIYPALPYALTGKMALDAGYVRPPEDPLYYFKRPGLKVPDFYHSQVKEAWTWLNERLSERAKLGTMDSRLYYVKDGDPKYFVMLDGREAWPLYFTDDPERMVKLLRELNVSYVYDTPAGRIPLWDDLPLTMYLGSPWLPEAYMPLPYGVAGTIYSVGVERLPIVARDSLPISLSYLGWRWRHEEDKLCLTTVSELEDRVLSDHPRIFVAAPTAVNLTITYLDEGLGHDDLNYYDKYTGQWFKGYYLVKKRDTGGVEKASFIVVPGLELRYVELGVHSHRDSLKVLNLSAEPLRTEGRCFFTELSTKPSLKTAPPALFVYLPLMEGGERVSAWVRSYGLNASLEIFEGVIQPWEAKWWLAHTMLARDPELPVMGKRDPSIVGWRVPFKAKFLTLVVVLWDPLNGEEDLDLVVEVGDVRTFITRPLTPGLLIRRVDVEDETLVARSSTIPFNRLKVNVRLYSDLSMVENLTLTFDREVRYALVKVYDLKTLTSIDPPPYPLFKAVCVASSSNSEVKVEGLTITLRLDLKELTWKGASLEDLRLYGYDEGWHELTPKAVWVQGGYAYVIVDSPSSGLIAITLRTKGWLAALVLLIILMAAILTLTVEAARRLSLRIALR
ncbi:MAG: hypothetical protein DRJ97_06690, partial [Thermoprotei archaeon]